MNTEELFDNYADLYQVKFNENPLAVYQRKQVYDILKPFLKADTKLLDVGCGPGSDFAFYKSHKLIVDAIDSSPRMIKLARKNSARLNFDIGIVHSSLQNYRPDSIYDIIILNFGVINVFENLSEILPKLASLLHRKGVLIVVSMPPFHLFFFLELMIRLKFFSAVRRLIKHKAIIESGFQISYYRHKDFTSNFKLLKRRNLAPLLPTPDQYKKWSWVRILTRVLLKTDQSLSKVLPEMFGGDHICYVLTQLVS